MKMKIIRLISVLCLAAVAFVSFPVQAQGKPDEPQNLYARSAVLMDAENGRVLFGKEEDVKRPMASTTKIMTCILALETMEEGQTAKVSDYAASQPKVHLGVCEGEEYYVKDLLYSLMLESHNDSAVVIAEEIGGSVEGFAALMNEKAKELGCADTHFVTPNGLDGEDEGGIHATTASDLGRVMKYCIMDSPRKEEFLAITGAQNYQFSDVSGSREFSCNNHNAFLTMMEGALSGKTGFTADAGYCYVGALRQNGKTLIVALLACGWPNHKNYKWSDTRTLMEYGLTYYEYRNIWGEVPKMWITVRNGVNISDIYRRDTVVEVGLKERKKELRILLRDDEKVEIKAEVKQQFDAPVTEGVKVGKVTYLLEGEQVAECDIVALGNVEKRDFRWCLKTLFEQIL